MFAIKWSIIKNLRWHPLHVHCRLVSSLCFLPFHSFQNVFCDMYYSKNVLFMVHVDMEGCYSGLWTHTMYVYLVCNVFVVSQQICVKMEKGKIDGLLITETHSICSHSTITQPTRTSELDIYLYKICLSISLFGNETQQWICNLP